MAKLIVTLSQYVLTGPPIDACLESGSFAAFIADPPETWTVEGVTGKVVSVKARVRSDAQLVLEIADEDIPLLYGQGKKRGRPAKE